MPPKSRSHLIIPVETRKTVLVIIGVLLLIIGLTCNDWLPTGLLHEVGSVGNDARRIALRALSLIVPVFSTALLIWRVWIAKNLAGIVAILFSTGFSLAAFVAGDIYLTYRAVRMPDPTKQIINVHIPDDLLGWRLKPGAIGQHKEADSFDVKYFIDENGFKAVENHAKPEFSIYFFGDSYTFGHGVSNADTYPNIIAREYLQDTAHVFNAGVMGYSIEQMYGLFLEVEKRLQPGDLVVFAPTSQDIKRNLKDFTFPGKLLFAQFPNTIIHTSRYPYYHNGQLSSVELATPWNTCKAFLFNGRWTKKIFRFVHSAITSPDTTREAIQMLTTARSHTEQRSARFALIFLLQTKERHRGRYEEDISQFEFYDVMKFFPSEQSELDKIRFKTDTHWNRAGHAIAARAIVQTLVKNGLLYGRHTKM